MVYLILIKIFGGFASQSWSIQSRYYGTGESFLFTLKPKSQIYKWTKKNSFFMYSTSSFISFGGG